MHLFYKALITTKYTYNNFYKYFLTENDGRNVCFIIIKNKNNAANIIYNNFKVSHYQPNKKQI